MSPTGVADLEVAIRWLLALVFLVSAITKFRDLTAFGEELRQYPLHARVQSGVKYALPALELALSGLLATGALGRAAGLVATLLLAAFTALALWAVLTNRKLRCACFETSMCMLR